MDREIASYLESNWMAGVRARFAFVDANNDGLVNADDLGVALASVGLPTPPALAVELIARYDADGDGRVSWVDYITGLTVASREQQPLCRALYDAFHGVDGDGDGLVTEEEMRAWYHSRGVMLSPDEVNRRLSPWDRDGDGRINFGEFVRMIVS